MSKRSEDWRGLWLAAGALAGILIAVVSGIAILIWTVRGGR